MQLDAGTVSHSFLYAAHLLLLPLYKPNSYAYILIFDTMKIKKQKITNFESIITQQNKLKEQVKFLEDRIAYVKQWSLQKNNPSILLQDILKALGNNTTLLSCSRNQEQLELTIHIKYPHSIEKVYATLHQISAIDHLSLVSLETQGNGYLVHLAGTSLYA